MESWDKSTRQILCTLGHESDIDAKYRATAWIYKTDNDWREWERNGTTAASSVSRTIKMSWGVSMKNTGYDRASNDGLTMHFGFLYSGKRKPWKILLCKTWFRKHASDDIGMQSAFSGWKGSIWKSMYISTQDKEQAVDGQYTALRKPYSCAQTCHFFSRQILFPCQPHQLRSNFRIIWSYPQVWDSNLTQ